MPSTPPPPLPLSADQDEVGAAAEVVVLVDGSVPSVAAVHWAVAVAAARSLPVLALVLDRQPAEPGGAAALLARAAPALERAGVPVRTHVLPAPGSARRTAEAVRRLLVGRVVHLLVLGDDRSPLVEQLVGTAEHDLLVLPGLDHLPPRTARAS